MGKMKMGLFSIATLLLIALSFACNGGAIIEEPPPPEPPPPYIPTPYADADFTDILDIALVTDCELAISEPLAGIHLFDAFGDLEGNISQGLADWDGLTGAHYPYASRGIIATGPVGDSCGWRYFFDSEEFTEKPSIAFPEDWWFDGIAHPPEDCNEYATSGIFECGDDSPRGIAVHPLNGWIFVKMGNTKITFDGVDCDLPYSAVPVDQDMTPGIIAMHPDAPGRGPSPDYYEGGYDWIAYHDYSEFQMVHWYGYPWCGVSVQAVLWDETNPLTFLPDREGINTANVTDFVFDAYGRMICVLPDANAWVITDPVNPPDAITIQRIIGGDPTGMSDYPGDFNNPTGCAINPRNQEILITDTGNDRVQVFDEHGNFTRMFGREVTYYGMDTDFEAPGAIDVDSMGNVYVETSDGLRVFNEYGQPMGYGCLEGYVKDRTTGATLRNCIVSIGDTRRYATVTSEDGYFSFKSLPMGNHAIFANRSGYSAEVVYVFINPGWATTTTIYLERVATSWGGGDVTGVLISSLSGDPISGLLVTIKGLGVWDTSNDAGQFHLYLIPEGDQVLQVLSNGIVIWEQDVYVNADAVTPVGDILLPIDA